jgi:MFS family permease
VRAEYDQIRDSIEHEHENAAKSYMELFKNKSSFRRLVLVCAIQASVQMTGVSAIQYYSPTIFSNMGIKTNDTLKYQGISSVLALLAQLCCILFIDKVGRRWAMIGGNLTNCLFFTIATIMLARFPPGATENASASWAFIAMTWLYNISFSATNGPLSCKSTRSSPHDDQIKPQKERNR